MKTLTLGLALLLLQPVTLWAQTDYEPVIGQAGKDVVWVPTPDTLITGLLKIAEVKPGDVVMDLGSGDGRIPIAAAKEFGATGVGIEYNPDLVKLSRQNAERAGVANKVTFVHGDIYETDLSKATVIAMYLLPRINIELRPKLLALKPGTRIVTHSFDMGDWEYDGHVTAEHRNGYFWIVPARVAGRWRIDAGGQALELELEQQYQMLSGRARLNGEALSISSGRVKGEAVQLLLRNEQGRERVFNGRYKNGELQGALEAERK